MHIEDDVFNEDMERIIYDEKVVGMINGVLDKIYKIHVLEEGK